MKTRLLVRLLTFTSWLPLAACASSDEGDIQPGSVGGSGEPAPVSEDGNLNASIDSSMNVNSTDAGFDDNVADSNNANGNKNNANLEGENEGGDSNFDDMDNEGNGEAVAAADPAVDAGSNINGFENNAIGTENAFKNNAPLEANTATAGTNEAIDAFKNTAIETNAFAGSQGNATENLASVSNVNAAPAAPIVEVPPPAPVPTPAPAPAVVPPPVVAAVAPAPQPVPHDIEATNSILHWVGYKINENLKRLDVEIVTKGRPEYEIFEQNNRIQQSELIIRFYHTTLRQKLRWDVNSSEFRSPVAYIRMKNKADQGYVDLVITHRDKVEPLFFEKNGNFLLSYNIPERYFGSAAQKSKNVKDKAISLSGDKPLAKVVVPASKLPAVGYPRYVAQFKEAPKLRPIREFLSVKKSNRNTKDGLPESFSKEIIGKRTGEILSRKTLLGVAQDDLENDFEDEATNNSANNSSNNSSNNAANNAANSNNLSNTNNGGNANAAANPAATNNFSNTSEPNAFSNLDNKAETITESPKANIPQAEAPMEDLGSPVDTTPIPAATDAPMMATEAQEVEPTDASGPKAQYSGKPIFMEFFDAPLSLVLKGFSEETGNNFVYPADVGSTTVTVNFKAVPWDEALKAILETYSLGMVRIGENVVRVDKIAALTGYMQALEAAKQFETRRIPTKVMIARLNNGVAKDIKEKVEKLLARDIEIDARIKISEDERTNSLVIEAPATTLAKANAIIARLDLETPQVEITSRIVEVRKENSDFFGIGWGNNLNFDPGRALGFGTLNFPNSFASSYSVDPGVTTQNTGGNASFRFGSLNKFLDLDLLLKLEEKKSTVNVLQSNRVLVLDGQKASVVAGSSQFFRPAGGGNIINPAQGGGGQGNGLAEVNFDLKLEVTPQVTALGNVIMNLLITSDTPGSALGETLASKSTRRLETQMVRSSGDTGVIGGIYDTKRTNTVSGIPWLSDLPIIGALFRSTLSSDVQTELLIMVTPTILSGPDGKNGSTAETKPTEATIISAKSTDKNGRL